MRCPNCGKDIEKGWNYCPRCGARFRRDFFSSVFDRMFSSMDRELKEMDKLMEKNIEAMDISPFFRKLGPFRVSVRRTNTDKNRMPDARGSGFSITIKRAGNAPPRVSVKTFGNVDRERLREQIQRQMGTRNLEGAGESPAGYSKRPRGMERTRQFQEAGKGETKFVHEPKTDVKRLDGRVVVNLDMPGVKSPDDIDVKELESSVEVKATAGDRAYFKILTKPGQFRLTEKSFSKGILHLEFS